MSGTLRAAVAEVAMLAGARALEHFGRAIDMESKSDGSIARTVRDASTHTRHGNIQVAKRMRAMVHDAARPTGRR